MFVGMTPSDEPSMRKRRVSDRPVRFLFARPAANDHKFLVALDDEQGEPEFRELEPAPPMVEPS
jgi:hypothetical protein